MPYYVSEMNVKYTGNFLCCHLQCSGAAISSSKQRGGQSQRKLCTLGKMERGVFAESADCDRDVNKCGL